MYLLQKCGVQMVAVGIQQYQFVPNPAFGTSANVTNVQEMTEKGNFKRRRARAKSRPWKHRDKISRCIPNSTNSEPKDQVGPSNKSQYTLYTSEPSEEDTVPVPLAYSHNLDHSSFILLCERTYEDLLSLNDLLRRELPFCLFLHVCVIYLNMHLFYITRSRGKRKHWIFDLLPENFNIPAPIHVYVSNIIDIQDSEGVSIKMNLPEIAIPRGPIPADESGPEVESGSFGPITAENHNVYECYVCPLVTKRLIDATRKREFNWEPLPKRLVPANAIPNQNLLGYREPEKLTKDGIQQLKNLHFMNLDSVAGKLKYTREGVYRVHNVMRTMADQYKMHQGTPKTVTNPVGLSFLEVNAKNTVDAYLAPLTAKVWSPYLYGPEQCSLSFLLGLKRKRNMLAPGLCFVQTDGKPIPEWTEHINANFNMTGPFAPSEWGTLESFKEKKFVTTTPNRDRSVWYREWTFRNFFISE